MSGLPENAKDLSLQEYHKLILEQRERQHTELLEVLNGLRYSMNDLVKALIVRKTAA
jgi:hypothetical protein